MMNKKIANTAVFPNSANTNTAWSMTPKKAFRAKLRKIKPSPQLAHAVLIGLKATPKQLPPWLFYDAEGSCLFDAITELAEYYLTRVEHGILAAHSKEIIARACDGQRLRIAELGAGSAMKTRLLLQAATRHQETVIYEPMDVSATALDEAKHCIEREISAVTVRPSITNYTQGIQLEPCMDDERRLVLYIGSSIGNFDPHVAVDLLTQLYAGLRHNDMFLLGADLVKDIPTLIAAYDDVDGVTAAFNKNMLARINWELDADFNLEQYAHRAIWNAAESRMEMHLESLIQQDVHIGALDLSVAFAAGERIHTESSYKYTCEQIQSMLTTAGFQLVERWTDPRQWFSVTLARRT